MVVLIGLIFVLAVAIAIAVLLVHLLGNPRSIRTSTQQTAPPLPYQPIARLLTSTELHFYRELFAALSPNVCIMAKVRVADLLGVRPGASGFYKAFNQISAKHVDFVLCEADTTKIVAAIELDDSTHQQTRRRKRDDFLNHAFASARVPLIRVPAARQYDRQALATLVQQAIAASHPAMTPTNQPVAVALTGSGAAVPHSGQVGTPSRV
ncbi:MAG: DUF2726 domain-containing protein [Planctomycetes bacterium]|nr:DUF2726 domain-containing protein [Planctomycetota bacterium]